LSGTIVAIGGAGFAMRSENEALHDYVLGLAASPKPRICLLPTAAGDPREQIAGFHAAMDRRPCEVTAISLFRLGEDPIDVGAHLLGQDVIYVTGGNMINLMALWREHGIDRILREAERRGIVLCGYSAGSMCWFEHGVSTGGGRPGTVAGLGLLAGSHCAHYAQDPERRAAFRALIASGELPGGLALDDHAAARFHHGALVEAVAARGGAAAAIVECGGSGTLRERRLPIRRLDPPAEPPERALEEMRAVRRMRGRSKGAAPRLDSRPR
jgi:dipeptidase E